MAALAVPLLAAAALAGCSSGGGAGHAAASTTGAAPSSVPVATATPTEAATSEAATSEAPVAPNQPPEPPPYPGGIVTGEPVLPTPGCVVRQEEAEQLLGVPITSAGEIEGPPPGCGYQSPVKDYSWTVYAVGIQDYHMFLVASIKVSDSWTVLSGYPRGIVAIARSREVTGWQILFYVSGKRTMGVCQGSAYGAQPPHEATARLCLEYAKRMAPRIG